MSIKYYANKVQQTSISTGSGNLVLDSAPLGFRSFVAALGANNKFNYYIYRLDTNFEWEIGIGYVMISGGVNILVKEKVVSSSNSNNSVTFTKGTKYVETIVSSDNSNSLININLEEKNSNFNAPNVSVTYVIDASVSGVTVSLPEVLSTSDPVIMGFVLNKTIGDQYEQANAILLTANGSQTIDSTGTYDVSIIRDYVQIASVPSQSGWVVLDPILESTFPYGNDGSVQFKYDSAFSGVSAFSWDPTNQSVLIGGTGDISSAHNIIAAYPTSTTIFNEQSYANDFRVEGTGTTHMFFVDGSENKIGINTNNPVDIVTINAINGNGLTIFNSGVSPKIVFSNTSLSGVTSNNIIGSIVFSGLNSSNNSVSYNRIYSVIDSSVASSENSSVHIEALSSGSNEDVAVFGSDGVIIGFNNQNEDGVVIGNASANEGNNIVLGSFHNICAENSVVIGDSLSLSSGTYGGLLGTNHSASGNNIWILGGSGVSVTGNNSVYLALNDNNHVSLINSGVLSYSTMTDNDVNFIINNSSILVSGISENIVFGFVNSSGAAKTGLLISSNITNISNNNENSSYVCKILSTGLLENILDLSSTNLIVGNNNYSGNNVIYGFDNSIINSGNFIFGSQITATGTNNIIFGKNISCSGTENTIVGRDNACLTSGNMGIVIVGNSNTIDEDYSISIGIDNANSGLYAVSCGYMNGVHGDYSVGIGENNTIVANGSVAFGRNNNLSNTDISATVFGLGVGNLGVIENTGIMIGYNNQMYGDGGILIGSALFSSGDNSLFGKLSVASGSNNIVFGNSNNLIGNNNILISNSGSLSGNNLIKIGNDTGSIVLAADTVVFDTNIINFYSGIYISSSGIVSTTGIFNNVNTNIININSLVAPTGTDSLDKLFVQNDRVAGELLALYTNNASGTVNLLMSSAEYQFFNPSSGNIDCILPNGSGGYLGKKFTIANLNSTYNIDIADYDLVSLEILSGDTNCSFVHAGDNKWIRITDVINN